MDINKNIKLLNQIEEECEKRLKKNKDKELEDLLYSAKKN